MIYFHFFLIIGSLTIPREFTKCFMFEKDLVILDHVISVETRRSRGKESESANSTLVHEEEDALSVTINSITRK